MYYTLNDKKFEKSKAQNEKEVIELLLINKRAIIASDKIKVEDSDKNIKIFEEFDKNKENNKIVFLENIEKVELLIDLKKGIIYFIEYFDMYTGFYINNILIENDILAEKIVKETRKDELKTLKSNLDEAIQILYNLSNIKNTYSTYILNHIKDFEFQKVSTNIGLLKIIINSILEIIIKLKIKNEQSINIQNEIIIFYDDLTKTKKYIDELIVSSINYINSLEAQNQLKILYKINSVCIKNIEHNTEKINLIYQRLEENKCCPVCYEFFNKDVDQNIYLSNCCNNKICEECIDEWYDVMNKTSCIFCNISNTL
jgi:hypothetical protein